MTASGREVLLRNDLAEWGGLVKDLRSRLEDEKAAFARVQRPWPRMLEQLQTYLRDRPPGDLVKVMAGSWFPPSTGRGGWEVCPECRSLTWLRESEKKERDRLGPFTCSMACKVKRKRPRLVHHALQARLLDYINAEGLPFDKVIKQTGVTSLWWWYDGPSHYLGSAHLRALADLLGISYEQAREEAGGVTGEEHHAEAAQRNLEQWKSKAGPQKIRAASKRGGRRTAELRRDGLPPEHAAAIRDAVGRRDNSPMAAALKTLRASPSNALLNPLWVRLRHEPAPRADTIRGWARNVATKQRVTPAAVLMVWKPYLVKKNLRGAAGRKPAGKRQEIFAELDASWPRTATGKRRRGFWEVLDERVSKAEGASVGVPALQEWERTNRLS